MRKAKELFDMLDMLFIILFLVICRSFGKGYSVIDKFTHSFT